jgi:hypothetical protein
MSRNVLITGGSGYIGGSLLADLKNVPDLPSHGTTYALVRSDDQAEKVKSHYNATPLKLDLEDQPAITTTLLEKQISVVFFLINAFNADAQVKFIEALAAVQDRHGIQTHFLHTTGAKLFSSFTGHPTDRVLSDAEDGLHGIQKAARSKFPPMETVCYAEKTVVCLLQRLADFSPDRPSVPTTKSSKLAKSTGSAHTSTSLVSSTVRALVSATASPSRQSPSCVLQKPCVGSVRLMTKTA